MQVPFLYIPTRHGDDRGWFEESYNSRTLDALGVNTTFVQDNHSYSAAKGTLRGLHFQTPPHEQVKLVRCLKGAIWDVVVDLRQDSPTYGRAQGIELTPENGRQIYVPAGFGHGFVTLTIDCEISYKVSGYYSAEHDGGVAWDDPGIGIDWPLNGQTPILSAKDQVQPKLIDFQSPFSYEGEPFEDIISL